MNKKIMGFLLSGVLAVTSLTGCGSKSGRVVIDEANSQTSLPLEKPITLRVWKQSNSLLTAMMPDEAEAEFYKELEKKTGVKVEFITPATGNEKEQFNVMVSSGELPDVIIGGWSFYSGGLVKAYEQNLIIDLDDYLEKYSPNLKKLYEENPELDRAAKTDAGNYLSYPFARLDKGLRTFAGPVVRKDWLDDCGLEEPETIDEWYTVLKAFKEKKGAKAPLSLMEWQLRSYPAFYTAFGIYPKNFYLKDGKIVYYAIQDGYKEFLKTLNKWYSEGLLDSEFVTMDSETLDAQILNGDTGAFIASAGSGLGKYLKSIKSLDPDADFIGTVYPSLVKGEDAPFGHFENIIDAAGSATITTSNKYPIETMLWLDYGFSEMGHMLNNFGIEGESYNMEDGYPKFTDYITKNSDGMTVQQMMARYIRASDKGPFVQDARFYEQYMEFDQQREALEKWRKPSNADILPALTATPEEVAKTSTKLSEINTYREEMFFKFVTGRESLDNFDAYVQHIKEMGIDEIISIEEEKLSRYNNR